jgi:hypothetical protein
LVGARDPSSGEVVGEGGKKCVVLLRKEVVLMVEVDAFLSGGGKWNESWGYLVGAEVV